MKIFKKKENRVKTNVKIDTDKIKTLYDVIQVTKFLASKSNIEITEKEYEDYRNYFEEK